MSDTELIQRVADALYAHAQETGGGYCPSGWTGHWREWYREVARVAVSAMRAESEPNDMHAMRETKACPS